MAESIFLGRGETPVYLDLKYANRHGLIAGATGTGKTVSLRILAEGFSNAGVPVFLADVKGDLAGVCKPSRPKDFLFKRAEKIGLDPYDFTGFPTVFWDLYGAKGHPVRTTISEMGPVLLSRLLDLNDTQEGILSVAFEVADDEGMLLLDLKDLRSMLTFVGDNAKALRTRYGNVSSASVGAIQQRLLTLEQQDADQFFGEPALLLVDLIRTDREGRGMINVLSAETLIQNPKLYSTFLLWLLSELFEELPEIGDPEKPKMVFFFDEAHLLFNDAPKALVDKVIQVVRLIRSKGVGVYFCTQSPADIPDDVLSQLGNRIQHALRAYTPKERKAVKAAADSFRENPSFDTAEVITELGVGEALVSTLQAKGVPSPVERSLIRPPASELDPISDAERRQQMSASALGAVYDRPIDRNSAYEMLQEKAERAAAEEERLRAEEARLAQQRAREREQQRRAPRRRSSNRDTIFESVTKSVLRQAGRELVRGVLGSLLRGR
ncbi:MAG: helicase HerA-like C-terminal domain-containing protein [Magnetospiraceae bacterium]